MEKLEVLLAKERENGGLLDIDTLTASSLTNYEAGYLDRENEIIVGLQTDAPLRRGIHPFGGIRMARAACDAYGYKISESIENEFKYRTTHNDGVFRVYTDEMKKARHIGIMRKIRNLHGTRSVIFFDPRNVCHIFFFGIYIIGAREQAQRRQNVLTEAFLPKHLKGIIRILNNVMQERDNCRQFILHLLREVERMKNIRHSAFIQSVFMRCKTNGKRFFCFIGIDHE
jgi:hypothetical protein